jgi:hypothetical protein
MRSIPNLFGFSSKQELADWSNMPQQLFDVENDWGQKCYRLKMYRTQN